jgi:hypothetical protein
MERMMKLQDVMLKAMAKKITWMAAAKIAGIDDASSEIYYAQLVIEESTRTVMAGIREIIENKCLFCSLYSDRGSHCFVTLKAGEKVDQHRLTQVGRAMKDLGIQMIPAYSP